MATSKTTTPAYIAVLRNGKEITVPGAVRSEKNGSGTYFFDEEGNQVANFSDGMIQASWPAGSEVKEAPPVPTEAPKA